MRNTGHSTIIFEELDRQMTAVYQVKGCEKVIVVRSNTTTGFNMEINTESLADSHQRTNNLMVITGPGDYDISHMPIACGMKLIFKVDDTIDPLSHLFVEILYETCIPEPCCTCNK